MESGLKPHQLPGHEVDKADTSPCRVVGTESKTHWWEWSPACHLAYAMGPVPPEPWANVPEMWGTWDAQCGYPPSAPCPPSTTCLPCH